MPLSVACVASNVCQLGDCADGLAHTRHASLLPVLLSSSLLMHSGEIFLRLKPYLVVEISPNIVTEYCCQVCVLSMMFCCSDCRQCADMVSDCAIRETRWRNMWFDLTPTLYKQNARFRRGTHASSGNAQFVRCLERIVPFPVRKQTTWMISPCVNLYILMLWSYGINKRCVHQL